VTLTVSNVVLPAPVRVYIGPESTAAPANSISKGTAWGGSWVEVGLTEGGATLKTEVEKYEVMVDQYNAPVKDFITKQTAQITFAVAESTLTQLKQAIGFGTVTSGSTESTLGVAATDGIPTYYAVGFEIYAPGATSSNSWYRRVIIWKGSPQAGVELKGEKGDKLMVSYEVNALVDTTQSASEQLFKIIDRVV